MRGEHQWAEKAPCQSLFQDGRLLQSAREPWGSHPNFRLQELPPKSVCCLCMGSEWVGVKWDHPLPSRPDSEMLPVV